MRAAANGENIAGVLNVDMIGYNSDSAPIIDLHARSWLPDSVALANLFNDVVTAYELDLTPHILVDYALGNYSDNKSFWDQGFAAILAIEDDDDFTPYYHTTNDRLSTLDLTYFAEAVKAAVATTVHMSGCLMLPTPTGADSLLPLLARD
jgi:Zn-dependent M28 family amino/carboxypeptidase